MLIGIEAAAVVELPTRPVDAEVCGLAATADVGHRSIAADVYENDGASPIPSSLADDGETLANSPTWKDLRSTAALNDECSAKALFERDDPRAPTF